MQRLFLTFFYTGLSPYAPGTMGSIAAAILGFVLLQYLPLDTFFLLTLLITVAGVQQINHYEKTSGTHDDKSIVIDEVAGLWLAFIFSGTHIVQLVLALVFFRFFDITKPSFIGRIDREVKGGWGVMGDDLLAGVVAGVCSALVYKGFSLL